MKDYTEKEIDSIVAWAKTEAWRVLITPLKKPSEDSARKHEPIHFTAGEAIIDMEKFIDAEISGIKEHGTHPTFRATFDRLLRIKELVEEKENHTPESDV